MNTTLWSRQVICVAGGELADRPHPEGVGEELFQTGNMSQVVSLPELAV